MQLEDRLTPNGGAPDVTFNGNGYNILPAASTFNDLIVDAANRTVAVGSSQGNIFIARFRPNGTLDPLFGDNGTLSVVIVPNQGSSARGVIERNDGSLWVSGTAIEADGTTTELVLLDISPTGTVRQKILHDIANDGLSDTGARLAANPTTGDIYVAASSTQMVSTTKEFDNAVVRFSSTGQFLNEWRSAPATINGAANAIAINPNTGDLYLGGTASQTFHLTHLGADLSFIKSGNVTLNLNVFTSAASAIFNPNNNQIYFSGTCSDGHTIVSTDTSLNVINKITFETGPNDVTFGLAIDSSGHIVAAGGSSVVFNGPWNLMLARLNPNLTFDTTFGTNGTRTYDLGSDERNSNVAIAPNGAIVTAGVTGTSPNNRGFVARYLPDNNTPSPPPPNNAPTFTPPSDITVVNNTTIGPITLALNDDQTPVNFLQVAVTCDNTTLFPPGSIGVNVIGSTQTLTLTPAAGVSGYATITVVVTDQDGATSTGIFHITVNPNTPPTATITPGSANLTVPVGTTFPSPLTFHLADSLGNPVVGVIVALTETPSTGAGIVSLPATLTTNASGDISFTPTANSTLGSYTITATSYGVSASIQVTNIVGPLSKLVVISGGNQTTTVGTAFGNPIVIEAEDAFGNPIPGVSVSASGSGATYSTPALTGADGKTSFTATAGTIAQTINVTVSSAGLSVPLTLTSTVGPVNSITAATSSLSVQVGASLGTLKYHVSDAFGNPESNVTVIISGPLSGAGVVSLPATLTTDADGDISFVPTANNIIGSYSITASINGLSASTSVTNLAGALSKIVVVSGSNQSATVGTIFAIPCVVEADDQYGNPIAGLTVSVSGTGATYSTPATTGTNGRTSFRATAGTKAGPISVTVSNGGVSGLLSLTSTAGPIATITIVSGASQSIDLGKAAAAPLVFAVADQYGNPASISSVSITAPAAGASAKIGTITPTLNAGEGSASITANSVTGSYQLTVSGNGVSTNADETNVKPPNTAGLLGYDRFAAGSDAGMVGTATLYDKTGTSLFSVTPFGPSFTGGIRVTVADFNGDGLADLVVGTGPGGPSHVKIFDGATQGELFSIDPFEASFQGGIYVAAGDINGDGKADLAITPDQGGGPRVRVFSGEGFTQIADFFGIDDPNFRGGARATIGDINGDGKSDLLVAAGFGGGPRLATFDGSQLGPNGGPKLFGDFFAFEPALRNGTFVSVGDVNGDGFGDIVAGGGPGGGPRVYILDGQSLVQNGSNNLVPDGNFFAGNVSSRGGIRVAVKNLDGDNKADIVTGAGEKAGSAVTTYLGKNVSANGGTPIVDLNFNAFAGFTGGVFVG
ncbi:MAG: FG-GAP-like repeat-containing protein [Gemmataceae bacterium]